MLELWCRFRDFVLAPLVHNLHYQRELTTIVRLEKVKPKGVTSQMKALNEYILTELFILLKVIHVFKVFFEFGQRNITQM